MDNKELWIFPVPSSCISTGVLLRYEKGDAILSFDYYDEEKEDKLYNSSIVFDTVVCHRHSSEKFTKRIFGAYDKLVEIGDSEWANHWGIKHFAIYLEDYGLYEFIAREFKGTDIEEGDLQGGS